MIDLIIKDGLGNQLFQYAYARYLQELYRKSGKEEQLVINPHFMHDRVFEHNDERKMSLQHFVLNPEVKFMPVEEKWCSRRRFKWKLIMSTPLIELYLWRIKKKKRDSETLFNYRAQRGVYYTYTSYTEYLSTLSNSKYKYVFGFFQTAKNFLPIADIIRKELIVKDDPTVENAEMIKQIQMSNSVCLHIRRGDYLNPRWKNLQICTFEYYNNAINEVFKRIENPIFFVFSNTHDDLEWIKENYHFKDLNGKKEIKIIYVDLNNVDYEEIRLMYNCKHFIISNSTFSWWGAYLSTYPQKLVIVPDRWNLAVNNDTTIYLEDWIKVSTK
jgi:hypothetical protein